MKLDDGDYLISSEELPALCELVGARPNTLSAIPPVDQPFGQLEGLKAEFAQLEAAEQRRLVVALAILRAPAKIAHIHHAIADETISRGQLAWSHSLPDSIIALARTGDQRRLSYWTESSLGASLRKILAADQTLSDDEIGCKLSTVAVITFLAILEQLRHVRLYSIMTHAQPTQYFSPAEIMDRLADAVKEDFRWPLLFVEKLIPGGLVSSLSEADVSVALKELIDARLVESVVETEHSKRYELTDAGKVICDGVLHDVSKVAICVADMKSDGQAGIDIVLLVRSSFHLFMFAMAGQTGALAALNNDELDDLLHNILVLHSSTPSVQADVVSAPPGTEAGHSVPDPPHVPPSYPAIKPTPEISKTIACPKCGGIVAENAAFCEKCGTPLRKPDIPPPPLPPQTKVCPNCNKTLGLNTKFCGGCGKPVNPQAPPAQANVPPSGAQSVTKPIEQVIPGFSALKPYFQIEFRKIFESQEVYKGRWNWAAFFFTSIWALCKGLWLSGIVVFVLSVITWGVVGFISCFYYGTRGNYLYYKVTTTNDQKQI